jgi:hypothetical protein
MISRSELVATLASDITIVHATPGGHLVNLALGMREKSRK